MNSQPADCLSAYFPAPGRTIGRDYLNGITAGATTHCQIRPIAINAARKIASQCQGTIGKIACICASPGARVPLGNGTTQGVSYYSATQNYAAIDRKSVV